MGSLRERFGGYVGRWGDSGSAQWAICVRATQTRYCSAYPARKPF